MAVSRTTSFGKRAPVAAPQTWRAPRAEAVAEPVAVIPPSTAAALIGRFPYFTIVLTFILGSRFVTELHTATDWSAPSSPGHFSLLAMGASDWTQVVGHGEWWRLFTQSVLHGSPSHLIGNLLCFLVVGFFLEPMIGTGWFAAIYLTGGFCGSILSMTMNPADTLSVGASGAIMATLATLFTLSFHHAAAFPNLMRRLSGGALFPALFPTVTSNGTTVDTWAHAGGAITGALLAFVVMAAWRESDDQPQGRSPAAIVAGLWAALTVWAFVSASTTYVQYAKDGLDYIPPTEIPDDSATMQEKSFALVEKYPKDPRARMFRGLYFLDKQDLSDAEPYFREAVRLEEARPTMTRAFRDWNTALLAVTVFYEHRPDEARAIAAPLCGSSRVDARAQNVLDMGKLCAK